MRGRFKVLFFFLLELLEFSEDRNRWESVEEKLNAIRYEFFAFVVCFYRSFIRPSFRPLVVPISRDLRPHLPLSSVSVPPYPCLPASHIPRSLLPHLCLFFALSFFYPYLSVLRFLRPYLHALYVLCRSFFLLFYLPPTPSLALVLTQRTHEPIAFHSYAAFLTFGILTFSFALTMSLFYVSFQRHDEKDGKTDEGWKRVKSCHSRWCHYDYFPSRALTRSSQQ